MILWVASGGYRDQGINKKSSGERVAGKMEARVFNVEVSGPSKAPNLAEGCTRNQRRTGGKAGRFAGEFSAGEQI